jgi:hypothetical protein
MSSPASPRRRAPWIIGGICALLALLLVVALVIGVILFLTLRSTPEDAVEQYLEAWNAQDCASYEEVTTERFRGGPEYTCESWQELLREQSEFEFEDEIGETTVDGDRASVEITETSTEPDGAQYRGVYTFELVKQDGRWLIDGTTTVQEMEEI